VTGPGGILLSIVRVVSRRHTWGMRRIVRYRVKPEHVAENERLVWAVYEELDRDRPPGLRYLTIRESDGVSFIHVAFVDTTDGKNPLTTVAAFKAFQADVKNRCDIPPAPNDVEVVGSYGFGLR
jgi:hypothetical protein